MSDGNNVDEPLTALAQAIGGKDMEVRRYYRDDGNDVIRVYCGPSFINYVLPTDFFRTNDAESMLTVQENIIADAVKKFGVLRQSNA